MSANNIHIPSICRPVSPGEVAQRRILLCGMPGEGKTYTILTTAPNPLVVDIDKGITDPRLVALNIPTYPLWDDVYVNAQDKEPGTIHAKKVRGLTKFIKEEASKMTEDQTLIIDSLSSYQDTLAEYLWAITPMGNNGKDKDVFKFYDALKEWYVSFFTILSPLKCHVVITAHLANTYSKDNPQLITGYMPMVEGSTRNFIGRFFTDVIRQRALEKKNGEVVTTEYKWQVKSDSMFVAKCRAKTGDSLYIDASFKSLISL